AQQARSATAPATTYDALNVTGSLPTETIATTTAGGANDLSPKSIGLSFTNDAESIGTVTGTADLTSGPGGAGAAGTVQIRVTSGGVDKTFDVTLAGTEADFNATKAVFDATTSGTPGDTLDNYVTVANDGSGHLELTATSADVDFSISASGSGSTAATLTAVGLTAGAHNSTSLLDNIEAQGGTGGTSTLVLDVTGQDAKTVTFGNAGGQVSTVAELNTWLTGNRGAATASISGTTFSLSLGAGSGNAIGLSATDVGVTAALGLDAAAANYNFGTGARGGMGSTLSKSFNSDLTLGEIDTTLANGGNISITVDANDGNGGQTQTVGLAGTDNLDDVVTKLKANATIGANLDISNVAGKLKIDAKSADVDFNIASGSATTALNLTAGQYNSTSLLDQITSGSTGGAEGDTLTIAANGG
ncbi:beta strand repeat-containing protein, partial [Rhodovulum sp. PH10]|uniref:beta strand repeat-containing protein n=1 Tax=Rhodovulum sp. PH10 TaxID=1187851 RepID=UPI00058CD6FF